MAVEPAVTFADTVIFTDAVSRAAVRAPTDAVLGREAVEDVVGVAVEG